MVMISIVYFMNFFCADVNKIQLSTFRDLVGSIKAFLSGQLPLQQLGGVGRGCVKGKVFIGRTVRKGSVDKRKERAVLGRGRPLGRGGFILQMVSSAGDGEAQVPGGLPGAGQRVPGGWLRGCAWESGFSFNISGY